MKKLFETMPLEGLRSKFFDLWGYKPPIGILHGHLWATVEGEYDMWADPPAPSEDENSDASHGDVLKIWGWKANSSRPIVSGITCRVRDDEFKQYVVLDKLEFGYSPPEAPTELRPAIRIKRRGTSVELPLEERFRLATFWTTGGALVEDESVRYPLKALHDQGLVYVFAYDVPVLGDNVMSLRDADHPDATEVEKFLSACRSLSSISSEDDRSATDVLFADDLWQPEAPDDESIGILGDLSPGEILMRPTRVIVAIAVTFCKERDDYVMGHFDPATYVVGMARLYPQVLTLSSRTLELVESAVRLTRPTHTTIVGGHVCGCGEMLTDIGMGFWNDVNAGNELNSSLASYFPYWENIFNYYLADPDQDAAFLNRRTRFVHAYGGGPTVIEGCVYRWSFPESEPKERFGRIERMSRQGAFDNVHLAPRMRVRQDFDYAVVINTRMGEPVRVPFDRSAWKMDRVVMAPFCAHDCFHMHTRWGDAVGAERHTKGFTGAGPYRGAAAPMVPINHGVSIVALGPNAFIWAEESTNVRPDEWDIGCYPGSGYACFVGGNIELARSMMQRQASQQLMPPPETSWALFYWHLRYHFAFTPAGVVVQEAVTFVDRAGALES